MLNNTFESRIPVTLLTGCCWLKPTWQRLRTLNSATPLIQAQHGVVDPGVLDAAGLYLRSRH